MFSLFLNPFTMIAGAALVLAPIIIHLINRLRYRKVPWAAMEFLLKSLKKNRRKLLLRQLILLLLRCLLVLMLGLLLARYIGAAIGIGQPRGTQHVVLLDDTASMSDSWREDGVTRTTFDRARTAIIDDITVGAIEANTPQSLEVIRWSNPDETFRIERLNKDSAVELKAFLTGLKPSALHRDVRPALEASRKLFAADPQSKHVLHVVSDFRARDWSGPSAEGLAKLLPEAVDGKAGQLHLLDVAHPVRSDNRSTAIDHGNVGIVDLQPETRTVGRYLPVEFNYSIANFTPSGRKNMRVVVRVNGQVREDASTNMPDVPPGVMPGTFTATFDRIGINTISATLEADEAGLRIDDIRYAAVEVREKVPLLFVSSDAASRGKQDSDGFYLRALFLDAARGFDVVERSPSELEQAGLDRYPAIFLLNVPRLSDKAVANVESYVRGGGGMFVALGEKADTEFYSRWHAGGKGLFPCPLSKPTEPLTDAQRFERMFDPALPPKAFPRGDNHPILARIYREDRNRDVNTYLKFLFVERYVPVPRVRWSAEPGVTDELMTLPNYRALDDYKEPLQKALSRLPTDDPKYAKFRDRLRDHQRKVKELLAANRPLYSLADALESMLNETADPTNLEAPSLREFWANPDQLALKLELQRFVESIRFGDPLLVAGRYGAGRVVLLTSTANNAWNDWPSGPGRPFFVMLMLETQKYLAGVGPDANRFVGTPLELKVDANRFEPRARRLFLPEISADVASPPGPIDKGEQIAQTVGNQHAIVFAEARDPGVYRFDLNPRGESGDAAKIESLAFAFNVDTAAEGDLRRATREELASAAPGSQLHTPGSGLARILRDRKSDLSESPWFFVILLLVLVAEQAMAVHLSYHLRGDVSSAVQFGTRSIG